MATYRVFKLEITAANSAFGDTDETRAVEIANILRRFADRLELRPTDAHLFDSNGNLMTRSIALCFMVQRRARKHGKRG